MWRDVAIVTGCFLVALAQGTTGSLNALSERIITDMSLSGSVYFAMATCSLIGIYFVAPAGYVMDKIGPLKIAAVGALFSILSLVAVSYVPRSALGALLMFVLWVLAGFCTGAAFLAALGLTVQLSATGGGVPVAASSAGMSASVFVLTLCAKTYNARADCEHAACWRNDVRVWAVAATVVTLPGLALMTLFNRRNYAHLRAQAAAESAADAEQASAVAAAVASPRTATIRSPRPGVAPTFIEEVEFDDDDIDEAMQHYGTGASPERRTLLPQSKSVNVKTIKRFAFHYRHLLFDVFFWALAAAYAAGIGSCMLVLTSITQLFEAYTQRREPLASAWSSQLLLMWSILNVISNVSIALATDYAQRRGVLQRPHLIVVVLLLLYAADFGALSGLTLATRAHAPSFGFVLALVGVAASFGAYLVLFPVIVAQQYGSLNFGRVFGVLQMAALAGALIYPNVANALKNAYGDRVGYGAIEAGTAASLLLSAVALHFSAATEKK